MAIPTVCHFICVFVITFEPIMIQTWSASQKDCQNISFVKDTYVDGKKLARNGRKTATYYAASLLPHYRRFLFSHLLVFNLWALANFDSNKRYISMKRKCRRNIVLSILENSTSDVLYLICICIMYSKDKLITSQPTIDYDKSPRLKDISYLPLSTYHSGLTPF